MNRQAVAIGLSSVRARLRMLPFAAGAAVALGSLGPSALADTTYTWVGNAFTAPGNWSPFSAGNWLNAVGPVSISDPTNALNFTQGSFTAVTCTNNISGTPFAVHAMS